MKEIESISQQRTLEAIAKLDSHNGNKTYKGGSDFLLKGFDIKLDLNRYYSKDKINTSNCKHIHNHQNNYNYNYNYNYNCYSSSS